MAIVNVLEPTEIYNKNVVLNILCELREGEKNKGYYILKIIILKVLERMR